tara:strand:+ start:4616 stop:5857 length:1242 start_codon:yes stop_codon:yes gene_type:complete
MEDKTMFDITRHDEHYYYEDDSENGRVLIQFKNPISVRNDIQCEIIIDLYFSDDLIDTFDSRLNIASLSQRESISRALKRTISGDIQWERILNNACSGLKRFLEEEDRSVDLFSVNEKDEEADWLIPNMIVSGGPNILFGKGGTSKTYLSLKMALSLAMGEEFLGHVPTRTYRTMFVDYEATRGTIASRLRQLNPDIPENAIWYFSPKGMPLHDSVPVLKKLVKKHDIEFLIIDSAALACGGRPEEAENAIRFFNALASIGTTSLTIAHETKAEGGNYPFGSVFFWNSPRSIWNIKAENEHESRALQVGLFHRKNNNGHLSSPVGVRVWFGEDKVEIKRGALSEEWGSEFPLKKRIQYTLRDGAKTLDELKDEFAGVTDGTLKKSLSQLKKRGILDNISPLWMLIGSKGGGNS